MSLSSINEACARVALGSVVGFVALVAWCYARFERELVYLEPVERFVAGVSAVVLSTALALRAISRLTRCVCSRPRPRFDPARKTLSSPTPDTPTSGVTWLSHATNLVSIGVRFIHARFWRIGYGASGRRERETHLIPRGRETMSR